MINGCSDRCSYSHKYPHTCVCIYEHNLNLSLKMNAITYLTGKVFSQTTTDLAHRRLHLLSNHD